MKSIYRFCCLHLCLLFAAPSYGFTLVKVKEERICQFWELKYPDESYRRFNSVWHFVWENNAKNISPTSEVSQLWTQECTYADEKTMNFNLVKEIEKKVSFVDFKTNVLITSQTYFCELSNLERLTLQEVGLVDVADVGLNLTSNCGKNNKCGQSLNYLQLSNNKFSILKNKAFCNLGKLETLHLDNCELESIEEKAFAKLKKLNLLSMHTNKLTLLSPYQFKDNLHLKHLILSYNNLSDHSIDSLLFLTQLNILEMSNNKIENINLQNSIYADLLTVDLRNNLLKNYNNVFLFSYNFSKLLLEGNKLTSFNFESYVQMKLIDLQNNQLLKIPKFSHLFEQPSSNLEMSNNNITSIDSFQFVNFTKMENINLASNKISTISTDAFTFDTEIELLDLSRNQIEILNNAFTKSKIKKIILDFNYIKELSYNGFSNFTEIISMKNNFITSPIFNTFPVHDKWSLVELDLSYNQLETIDISLPNSLKKLNLRGNKIKKIFFSDLRRYFNNLNNGVKLEEVSLTDNEIEFITHFALYYEYFEKQPGISLPIKVQLDGNILKCSCENMWMLNFKNSFIKFMRDLNFIECFSTFHFETDQTPKHFLSLRNEDLLCESNFNNSNRCKVKSTHEDLFPCKFTCPTQCICYTSSNFTIAHIYCSKKNLSKFPTDLEKSQIQNSTNLILYLDGNNFNIIKHNYFNNYSYLKQLHLNQSNIRVLEKSAFDLLPMLKILHLENNKISDLPADIFINLHNLQELHLSNNLISHLKTKWFFPLNSLQFLSLDNNYLLNSTVWELEPLKILTLHSNPWSCDCHFALQFQQFLQNHTAMIPNIRNVFCTENGKNLISLLSFNSTHCFPSVTNSLTHILLNVAVVFISMAIIAVLIFIYRQEVQVLIYSHYKIRLFNKQKDVGKKFYDAFVIYSDLDVHFLIENFIPKLEQIEHPYKLCVHDRDFLPGAFIQDNIIQAVQESYRSIVLLNQNLLNSKWCLYEFKVAHAQMVNDGNHRVILIVMGEIPDDIDEEMKLYLKTNTYLKWNEKLFWEKLYFVMSDKRVSSSSSQFLKPHYVDGHVQLQPI